jgi:hypothetical protein
MHSQFMEFFGSYLIQAARWQKQFEKTMPGITPNIMDLAELGRLFQQVCGTGPPSESTSAEYVRIWQEAIETFQSVVCPHPEMWGWIPRADFQVLQEKCDSLEKTIREKDQIISQLRSLLEEKGLGQSELFQRFQSLLQDQNDEFQIFMKNFGDAVLHKDGRKPKDRG